MRRLIVLLERAWRNTVVYPTLRLIINNRQVQLPIDLSKVGSILILRYDKIGDMIVTLPIFQLLKSRNPRIKIGVLASTANVELVRADKNVDDCFVVYNNPLKLLGELNRIRKAHYPMVLNFIFNRMTSGGLICNFACRNAIKIGQGQEKYRFYFNVLLSIPRGTTHMFEMLIHYIEQIFGIRVLDAEKSIRFTVDEAARDVVDRFLEKHGLTRCTSKESGVRSFVILNVSARQDNKRLLANQVVAIAAELTRQMQLETIVISAPEDRTMAVEVVAEVGNARCIYFPELDRASLLEIASLVEGATCLVTPDTAVIHIASAMGTPVVGIFTPLQVNQEWLPYKTKYGLIKAPENQPVSSIPPGTLVSGVRDFLDQILPPKNITAET